MAKKLGLIISMVILSLAMTACGSEAGKSKSDELTVYTALPEQEALYYFDEFEKETGIKVNFVRLSAGQILARAQAEQGNPQGSVWYGSPSDTLIAASELELLESYKPENADLIPEEYTDSDWDWTPVYVGALGFASNSEWLEDNGLEPPTSWDDLLKPEYADNVSVAHPASAGTAYTVLATLIQLKGEDEAFDYLKSLDKNIRQYTQSGAAPARDAGLGEVAVGIGFAQQILAPMEEGYPITISYPEDGTGYEVGSAAIIKDGPEEELENAKTFIDWTVSKEGQETYSKGGYYRLPVNEDAEIPKGATPLDELNLIEYDAVWAGEVRKEITNKFEEEIGSEDEAQ